MLNNIAIHGKTQNATGIAGWL